MGEWGGGNAFCPGTSLILVNLMRGVSCVLQSSKQDVGSAHEEGTILLPGPVIVLIFWNDLKKSRFPISRKSS